MSIVRIAEIAEVGVGTVSRYINGSGSVSDDAAKRIAAAMAKINYKPKMRRPGPKTKDRAGVRTGVVLLLTLSRYSPEQMQGMPAFPMLFGGIQAKLFGAGMTLMFQQVKSADDVPEMLDARFCDGVIVMMAGYEENVGKELLKRLTSIPTVWCFREHRGVADLFDCVFFDNASVGTIAANRLASEKHSHVVYLNAEPGHPAFGERENSFVARCRELGVGVEVLMADGCSALAERFVALECKPTGAFFCADNFMLGTSLELTRRGYDVAKLEMIGCNNESQFLDLMTPRPATIDLGFSRMGRMTAERLLARVNRMVSGRAEFLIEPEFIAGSE